MNFRDTFDPRIYRPAAIHDNINVKWIEDYRGARAEERRQKFLPKSLDNPVPPGTRGLFPFPMHLLYIYLLSLCIPSLYKSFRVIRHRVKYRFCQNLRREINPPPTCTRYDASSVHDQSIFPCHCFNIDQSFGINISFPRCTNRNNFKQIEFPFEKRFLFNEANFFRALSSKHFHIIPVPALIIRVFT